MENTFNGRQALFKALVGSHNYGLNTPESDKDYKVFTLPTFDDLYNKREYSSSSITEIEDNDCHDIRKISDLLYKSNINFMEVLFSRDIVMLTDDEFLLNRVNLIFENKNLYATMNLTYLYKACMGMYYNKSKQLTRGTSGTLYLVEKYGFDTKQALHAYRVLDFIERFLNKNFNFANAMRYDDQEAAKMLEIKNGKYNLVEIMEVLNNKLNHTKEKYEDVYCSKTANNGLKNELDDIVKQMVRYSINQELQTT